jgi:hypothetical protein
MSGGQSSVDVLGQIYTLRSDPPKKNLGYVDHESQVISVKKGMEPGITYQTLMHEIIHVIDVWTGLNLTEEQVEALATGVAYVLNKNPHVRGEDCLPDLRFKKGSRT